MAKETHTVTYKGSVSDATLLVQMLEIRGVAVEWKGIPEQGRAPEVEAEGLVDLTCIGADEAIEAAVRVFRARVPRAAVKIDEPGQVQSD